MQRVETLTDGIVDCQSPLTGPMVFVSALTGPGEKKLEGLVRIGLLSQGLQDQIRDELGLTKAEGEATGSFQELITAVLSWREYVMSLDAFGVSGAVGDLLDAVDDVFGSYSPPNQLDEPKRPRRKFIHQIRD